MRQKYVCLLASLYCFGCYDPYKVRDKHEFVIKTDSESAEVYLDRDGEVVNLGGARTFKGDFDYEVAGIKYNSWTWISGLTLALVGLGVGGGGSASESGEATLTGGSLVAAGLVLALYGLWLDGRVEDVHVRRLCPNEFLGECDDSFVKYTGDASFDEDHLNVYLTELPPILLTVKDAAGRERTVMVRDQSSINVKFGATTKFITGPVRGGQGAFQAVSPDTTETVKPSPDTARPQPPVSPSKKDVPATKVIQQAAPQPTSYALIIGLEKYRELPSAKNAQKDAEDFAHMLEQRMGIPLKNMKILLNERATRGDILAQIAWLQANIPDGARAYVFFSGHGTPDVSSGTPYILPYEATADTLKFTGLDIESDILKVFEQTNAREVLVFVDACFSGQGERSILKEGVRPLVPVKRPQTGAQIIMYSASNHDEVSGSSLDDKNGLFTAHLLDALAESRADTNGDGQLSLYEIDQYVAPRVERDAQRSQRKQRPVMTLGDKVSDPNNVIVVWGIETP